MGVESVRFGNNQFAVGFHELAFGAVRSPTVEAR